MASTKLTRRTFLEKTSKKIIGFTSLFSSFCAVNSNTATRRKSKNWIWISPNLRFQADDWKRQFEKLKLAGIDALFPEIYRGGSAYFTSSHLPVRADFLERFIQIAKSFELEIHAWMWTMPCSLESMQKNHADWYTVNRLGESSVEKPAYVNYYKFLCPAKVEVHEFIQNIVEELSQFEVDGIHLDYIRYPDVILPQGLWSKYNLIQDKEYPQFDYCYCETCRKNFKAKEGIDPLSIVEPAEHKAWLQFRYDQLSDLVNNKLIPIAHKRAKMISAAVFPNWKNVRQQWPAWKLDAVFPMLYNRYYLEDADWIKNQCEKGIKSLKFHKNLYSGLMLNEPNRLKESVIKSFEGGAKGISIFSLRGLRAEHLDMLTQVLHGY